MGCHISPFALVLKTPKCKDGKYQALYIFKQALAQWATHWRQRLNNWYVWESLTVHRSWQHRFPKLNYQTWNKDYLLWTSLEEKKKKRNKKLGISQRGEKKCKQTTLTGNGDSKWKDKRTSECFLKQKWSKLNQNICLKKVQQENLLPVETQLLSVISKVY